MRILQMTLGFYPAQAWGGPVKIVHQNSKELVRRGHEVTVYCTNLLNKRQKIRPGTFEDIIDGIRVVYMNTVNFQWWPGTLGPIWIPDLPKYLRREINNFDIVHRNGYRSPIGLLSTFAAQKAGKAIVIQPHGSMPAVINTIFLKRLYDNTLGKFELKDIDSFIALQESERDQALEYGIPAEIIDIIPNGIDTGQKKDLPPKGSFRNKYNIQPDKPVVLFIGRISKVKGTDMLVEAFARMKRKDVLLVIAGPDDGQLNEVKELIQNHKLGDRVVFTGLLSGSDVFSAYQDSDLLVLPSRTDMFPVTVMEACLMDNPMLLTDRCKIANLVKDRVADVVPFDVEAFSNGMDQLLLDHERYLRYQSNCQAVIRDTFSIQTVVDRLENVYRRIIEQKAQHPIKSSIHVS